jgi:hypothetical protein
LGRRRLSAQEKEIAAIRKKREERGGINWAALACFPVRAGTPAIRGCGPIYMLGRNDDVHCKYSKSILIFLEAEVNAF